MGKETKTAHNQITEENLDEGRTKHFMDIERMINEGLGGGQVTRESGWIEKDEEFPKEEAKPTLNGKNIR